MRTRRIAVIVAFAAALVSLPSAADATCQPGRIGFEGGRPVVQLPRCQPPPQ